MIMINIVSLKNIFISFNIAAEPSFLYMLNDLFREVVENS